jgi:dihydroneopterin aldolase
MTRNEQLQAAAKLAKAIEKLAVDEATAMAEATERVKARYEGKRAKLLEGVPADVLEMARVDEC